MTLCVCVLLTKPTICWKLSGLYRHWRWQSLKSSHPHRKQTCAGALSASHSQWVSRQQASWSRSCELFLILSVCNRGVMGGRKGEGGRRKRRRRKRSAGRNPLERILKQKGGVIGNWEKAHTGTSQSFLERFPVWLPRSSGIYLLELDSSTVHCRLFLIALWQRDPYFSSNPCFPHRKLVSPQGTSK